MYCETYVQIQHYKYNVWHAQIYTSIILTSDSALLVKSRYNCETQECTLALLY